MAKQRFPASDSGAEKRGIKREPDKGGVPRQGKLGSLKKGDDAATRNARGMWAQQGRKASTGEGTSDHQKPAGK